MGITICEFGLDKYWIHYFGWKSFEGIVRCHFYVSNRHHTIKLVLHILLQAIYALYRNDNMLKLPYCIIIAGIICALFAFGIPHLSGLRIWLGFSTFFSLVYIVVTSALSLKDGIAYSNISFFLQYHFRCSFSIRSSSHFG